MTTRARAGQIAREVLRDGPAPVGVGQLARGVLRDADPAVLAAQLSRDTLRDAAAPTRAGLVYRCVLRSGRDSPYPNFPVRLFAPPSLRLRLEGAAETGGMTTTGDAQVSRLPPGGRWVIEFSAAQLWRRADVLAWRDFSTACDASAMNCIVPLWDRRHQPFATTAYDGTSDFARVVWRDTQVWEEEQVHAELAEDASRWATELKIRFTGGQLAGGEHFSIYGPRYGWRLYRVARVKSIEDGVTAIEIRPPLREWADAADPRPTVNFDSPRCSMQAQGDISEIVRLLRFGEGRASFVESFNRYP